ncbi:hypothetical protein JCM13304A_09670 [Desulfothermus okinawensis JCM 13304]
MEFHGVCLSEPMCFGIGQGLGIWYLKDIPDAPTVLFHGRCYSIESNFFKNLKIPFAWEQFEHPQDSTKALIKKIDKNVPILIQTDIYYLPYFNSSTHFPGHAVVVWGYDDSEMIFFLSDTEKKDLLKVGFKDLQHAMFFKGFFNGKGNQFGPEQIVIGEDIKEAIKNSMYNNSYEILNNKSPYSGISALDTWIQEYKEWADYEDWRWCARFTYQIIEKRGTGGGAFRLMYSEFLDEVSSYFPEIKEKGLPKLMAKIGNKWRELAYLLKEVSEKRRPSFEGLGPHLCEIRDLEYNYHLQVVKLFH